MKRISFIIFIILFSGLLKSASFFDNSLLPSLLKFKFCSLIGEQYGRNNIFEISIKSYFNLKNVKLSIKFKNKDYRNSFLDSQTKNFKILKKNSLQKIRFRYTIDAGYKKKKLSDFFRNIRIVFTCLYPKEEVYSYIDRLHPDNTEDLWFELKKKFIRSREKIYTLKRIYTVLLPSFEGFKKDYYPLYFSQHHSLPGDLPYSFMVYIPKEIVKNRVTYIKSWEKTLNLISPFKEKINNFIIKNSIDLKRKYNNYIKSLRLEFYFNLFKRNYKQARYAARYLLDELKNINGNFFWNDERISIVINFSICDFLDGNRKRAIKSLENLRLLYTSRKNKRLLKYILYDLAIFYYFQDNLSFSKTLLKKSMSLDSSLNLSKKLFLKINE